MKFKVLYYGHIMVDVSLLSEGIYQSSKPHIFNINETIDSLLERYKNITIIDTSQSNMVDVVIENLKKCELKVCQLKII